MEANFWHEKWEQGDIGFHQSQVNPLLVAHLDKLNLVEGARFFLPLCGKTLDIAWLLARGYRIVGVELSTLAIKELFTALDFLEPEIATIGTLTHYSAKNIDIFVGDIFDLSSKMLGAVDAIYDRAALVALPKEMRHRYTAHLVELTHKSPQLLISYEYEQNLMEGPPFSVSAEEIEQHYRNSYDLTLVVSTNVPGGLKGICAAKEHVWLLQND